MSSKSLLVLKICPRRSCARGAGCTGGMLGWDAQMGTVCGLTDDDPSGNRSESLEPDGHMLFFGVSLSLPVESLSLLPVGEFRTEGDS